MVAKANGAEFKAFYDDKAAWPGEDGDTHHDDAVLCINGLEQPDGIDIDTLKDTDTVTIISGYISSTDSRIHGRSLESHFRKWKARQSTRWMTVECDAANLEAVKAAVVAAGGKVR